MSDNLELDRVTEKREAPPKAWRNKWYRTGGYPVRQCGYCDADHSAGEKEWWGCKSWPSKEVAEQKASEDMRDEACADDLYLGAFPVPTT